MKNKIFIAGGTCSGKSTLAKEIALHMGYSVTSFGDILRKYAVETGGSLSTTYLQNLGQGLIDKLGYDGFLKWIIEHSPHILWNQPLVLDGLRHVTIYEHLTHMFPQNILVYCDCNQEIQLTRLLSRDDISIEDAHRILSHILEKSVSTLKPKAHLLFRPEDSIKDFLVSLTALIKGDEIQKNDEL